MGICIDVDKLIRLLKPAKCDYHPLARGVIAQSQIKFGLSISQILELLRECIDKSAESWFGEEPQQIREEFELLMAQIQRIKAAEKLDYQKNLVG